MIILAGSLCSFSICFKFISSKLPERELLEAEECALAPGKLEVCNDVPKEPGG